MDESNILGNNLYVYCVNNPVNYYDPTGMLWEEISDLFERTNDILNEYFTPSNVYSFTISSIDVGTSSLYWRLIKSVENSIRPNNIGAGLYSKMCADDIASFTKLSSGTNKVLNKFSYVAVAIDVCGGIYNNIQNNASTKTIISDAVVDTAVTGGSIRLSGSAGAAIGASAGTVCPGLGNVIGGIGGFAVGVCIYVVTDRIEFNGKTAREWLKEGVGSLW